MFLARRLLNLISAAGAAVIEMGVLGMTFTGILNAALDSRLKVILLAVAAPCIMLLAGAIAGAWSGSVDLSSLSSLVSLVSVVSLVSRLLSLVSLRFLSHCLSLSLNCGLGRGVYEWVVAGIRCRGWVG
jgi:hypothetical protein